MIGLHTARRNLHNAQAELPQLEALLADAEGRFWVLLGGYRADLADLLPDSLAIFHSPRTCSSRHSG